MKIFHFILAALETRRNEKNVSASSELNINTGEDKKEHNEPINKYSSSSEGGKPASSVGRAYNVQHE